MRKLFPLYILMILGIGRILAPLAYAQMPLGQPRIYKIEIKHVGPPATSDQFVRDHLKSRVGDVYQPAVVDEDIRTLYNTGYFYNIRVVDERTPVGVILTYVLQGRPTISAIKFEGNKKFSSAKLSRTIKSKVGAPLDEYKLFQDTQEIHKLYQKSGYAETTVQYRLSIDESTGRGTVTFEIKEARKIKIADVRFEGARPEFIKDLKKSIYTRKYKLFSWILGRGVLKKEEFEDDKERIAEFYRERGFLDFELKNVRFEYPTSNKLIVVFEICEGPQYRVGSITFKGATLLPTNALTREFKPSPRPPPGMTRREWERIRTLNREFRMKSGDIFSPRGLQDDIKAIENFYGSKAYVDVTEASGNLVVRKRPNIQQGTIDLEFEINEGSQSFVEKIEIRGNEKTKDRVIRRELAIYPGEPFEMDRVEVSKARLEGLRYFEKVEMKTEPTEIAPNRKNLVVEVKEQPTGFVTVGAGFSSIDRLFGFAEYNQGNFDLFNPPTFTGGGQKARAYFALGTRRRDAVLTFIEPWFMDRRLELGTELYHRWLDFESLNDLYTETRTGIRLWLRKPIWTERLTATLAYNLENIGLDFDPEYESRLPSMFLAERGDTLLSRVSLTLAYDTRGKGLLPNRGQRTELMGEVTGGPFGGEKSFYRLQMQTAWYFRGLTEGHVLELGGRIGVADAFGSTPFVPFYDRYYLGGMYTLRGYKYRAVGPKELVNGTFLEPIGGCTYWLATAEYSIPLITRVRLAAFYDIGMVYPDAFSFSPQRFVDPNTGAIVSTGTYADNFGFGLRLDLPIGPLRLDVGFPLTHDPTLNDSPRFNVGVGYTRQF